MQANKPAITEVTMWDDHNYVSYSDTDSQADYFDGYCLDVRQTLEWIKKDGGCKILVRFGNGLDRTRYRKRLAAICKHCGYSFEEQGEELLTATREPWTNCWFVLTKHGTRRNISSAPSPLISRSSARAGRVCRRW